MREPSILYLNVSPYLQYILQDSVFIFFGKGVCTKKANCILVKQFLSRNKKHRLTVCRMNKKM